MVFEKIKEILVTHHNCKDSITEESTFYELGLDSYDLVELIMDVEADFNIEITDDELVEIETVGDVVRLVEGRV